MRGQRRQHRQNRDRLSHFRSGGIIRQKAFIWSVIRIYSSKETNFVSENKENLKCFEFLSKHFSKSNIRTTDIGFDCNKYYEYFIKNNEKFIIRAKKKRNVIYKDKTVNILKLANQFNGKYKLEYIDKSGIKSVKISIIPIRMCEFRKTELNLVVIHGLGATPMMLITNLHSDDKRLCTAVCKAYLMRWRMEVIEISKRLFGAPDFVYYAVADGISEILKAFKSGFDKFFSLPNYNGQLFLFSASEISRLNFRET